LLGKPEGKRPLGRPRHTDGKKLKQIIGKLGGKMWTAIMWLRIGTTGRPL
jgi:hypothetical protein